MSRVAFNIWDDTTVHCRILFFSPLNEENIDSSNRLYTLKGLWIPSLIWEDINSSREKNINKILLLIQWYKAICFIFVLKKKKKKKAVLLGASDGKTNIFKSRNSQ